MSGRLKRNTMKNIRRHHIARLKHKRKRDMINDEIFLDCA